MDFPFLFRVRWTEMQEEIKYLLLKTSDVEGGCLSLLDSLSCTSHYPLLFLLSKSYNMCSEEMRREHWLGWDEPSQLNCLRATEAEMVILRSSAQKKASFWDTCGNGCFAFMLANL